jgi:hypothetical protein
LFLGSAKETFMAEVQIKRHDIDSLAEKLSRLEPELSPPERALLLFMLGVAADSIQRSGAGERHSTLVSAAQHQPVPVVVEMAPHAPSISQEFATAFTPGAAGRVRLLPGSVGPGPT